jgi:hypothetical protein
MASRSLGKSSGGSFTGRIVVYVNSGLLLSMMYRVGVSVGKSRVRSTRRPFFQKLKATRTFERYNYVKYDWKSIEPTTVLFSSDRVSCVVGVERRSSPSASGSLAGSSSACWAPTVQERFVVSHCAKGGPDAFRGHRTSKALLSGNGH